MSTDPRPPSASAPTNEAPPPASDIALEVPGWQSQRLRDHGPALVTPAPLSVATVPAVERAALRRELPVSLLFGGQGHDWLSDLRSLLQTSPSARTLLDALTAGLDGYLAECSAEEQARLGGRFSELNLDNKASADSPSD